MDEPLKLVVSRFLDVQESEDGSLNPPGVVRIPFSQLFGRIYELPSRDRLLYVVGMDECPEMVLDGLRETRQRIEGVYAADLAAIEELRLFPPNARPRLWSPPAFLEEQLVTIPRGAGRGRALCLACGVGREAVHLASLGWDVVAVDWLPDALERGRRLEEVSLNGLDCPMIQWVVQDLKNPDLARFGKFDLVIQFMYNAPNTPEVLEDTLAPEGTALLESFDLEHRARFGKPESSTKVLREESYSKFEFVVNRKHHRYSEEASGELNRVTRQLRLRRKN